MNLVQLPELPGEAYVLAAHLPALADEIVAAIAADVPEYARPLARGSGAVRRGVHSALAEFVELSRGGAVAVRGAVAVDLGRREVRAGRSLDALLSAYRTGARVAWRRLAALGLEAGLAPETLVVLAEAIFAYVDELSAESAEGFAREQAERAGELERRRRSLAELLVATPAPDAGAVAAAAEAAHWRLPTTVAIAVWREHEAPDGLAAPAATPLSPAVTASSPAGAPLSPAATASSPADALSSPAAAPARPALPADALRATVEGLACAVLAGPARELPSALDGRPAGIGPAVPLADAARSFRLACAALALAEDRGIDAPLAADAHRVELLWRAEPALVAELAAERLSPLSAETVNSRARLEATLLAWLRHAGTIAAVAGELDVHPQTVRYRLGRLRELFGAALDEPDARFELELVLRARAA
ncbi:helix-turn-helix domain-containing protein [Solirubrobacter ginsenosidimutans]|uniref:Helix-turn-helix domain-containing protein n=1 Tax=Solirubrobacter ginsenosidimutans TaxID=490573 RepID=A0A9X3S0T1_9ACTN|nr:PucR family transcriptional regulator [Solirubrobacter ginsenosidimutans]MDA0159466.1 helix-turn-helix domain-containing protein [Solirubrobacter ginsenosidimutans]